MYSTIKVWISSKVNFWRNFEDRIVERTLDQNLLKMCQKMCYQWGYDIFKTLVVKWSEIENGRLPKIRLHQCYVLLWIHVIDTICTVSCHNKNKSKEFHTIVINQCLTLFFKDHSLFLKSFEGTLTLLLTPFI